jgi:hypothetical protein
MKLIRTTLRRVSLAYQAFRYGKLHLDPGEGLRTITEEEIQQVKVFFPRPKYFVFGHARSGTTLLARLLRVHPEVHCNWQTHFFTREPFLEDLVAAPEVQAWLSESSNRWIAGQDFSPLAVRAVGDLMLEREAHRLGKRVVGDKSPNTKVNGEAVRKMHRVYPDAKLIFIVRDGRDTAISHRFLNFIDFPEFLSEDDLRIREAFAHDPGPFFQGQRSIFSHGQLQEVAAKWVKNVEETHSLGKKLFQERYFSLRYEDLVAHPLEEMGRLWDFLEVDSSLPELRDLIRGQLERNPDAAWQKEQAEELVENLEKGKAGNWEELFTQKDKVIFHEVAGSILNNWGYS